MAIQEKSNVGELASLVGNIAQIDGDCSTQIPALKLARRSSATEPMPCIYGLGLAACRT